jgi:predicted TIM-barrel fold metal-dependent hydrolase
MVVDAHTHVFAPLSERFPRDVHELFLAEAERPAEALLEEMERVGVDRAVVVPLSAHDEYVGDVLARHPGRFAAIGVAGSPDVEEYRRRREAAGLQGLRVFGVDDEAVPLLAELERTGGKLWFFGGREQMEHLAEALEHLPRLTVVLNHLGYWLGAYEADEHGRPRFLEPYSAENLEFVAGLARFPAVHVLLSGLYAFAQEPCPYRDLLPVTAALLEAYGPERLLAGTDFPWIAAEPGYAATWEALDLHLGSLDAAGRAAVRGGNAERLFFS